jgi:hypothetical protein
MVPFRLRLLCSAFALSIALTACSRSAQQEAAHSADNAPASSPQPAATGTNAAAAQAFASQRADTPQPDASVPLANYTLIDQKAQGTLWLTYLAVAYGGQTLSDEDKLNLLSPRYYSEPDAFRKHQMASAELAEINANLARYKAQRYYALKLNDYLARGVDITQMLTDGYDFDSKSFAVMRHNCWSMSYSTVQSVTLHFTDTKAGTCAIHVADENVARTIEQARAGSRLNALGGVAYFFISGVENGNNVTAQVTHVRYDVTTMQQQALGSFDE